MNVFFQGAFWNLAERYTDMVRRDPHVRGLTWVDRWRFSLREIRQPVLTNVGWKRPQQRDNERDEGRVWVDRTDDDINNLDPILPL